MKKGIIKIIGGIGSYTSPDGKFVKGVDLTDVISQVRSQGEVDGYTVIVKSMGGLVSVGYDIYNYIRGLKKPITTIIDKQSASIATVVSLAGDKGQRLIIQGSEFFIHNPWITETGTADQLAETSSNIRETEKELVAFYADNTGITKEGIAPLMRDETGLTPEKAVELGFCDKVITQEEAATFGVASDATPLARAFALLTPKQTSNNNDMKKELSAIGAILAGIQKKLGIKNETTEGAKALDWTTTDTAIVVKFESAGKTPVVGDVATVDGQPAADGTYNFDGGYVVTIKDGKVESIVAAAAEETPAALKAKITALEADKKDLEAKNTANETALAELKKTVEEIGKHIETNYKAPGGPAQGNKGEQKDISENTYFADRKKKVKETIAAKNEKK